MFSKSKRGPEMKFTWLAKLAFIIPLSFLFTFHACAQDDVRQAHVQINGVDNALIKSLGVELGQSSESLRGDLVHALEQNGYIGARVFATSTTSLSVDLGSIKIVTINGVRKIVEERIHLYLLPALDGPPRIQKLDHALALINDMPGVVANFALHFLEEENTYELIVDAQEFEQAGAISVDSTPRNLFSQNRVSLQQNFNNVLVGGDLIRFQGSFVNGNGSPNQYSYYGAYLFPVGDQGAFIEVDGGDIKTETNVHGASQAVITTSGFTILPGTVSKTNFDGVIASINFGYPLERSHSGGTYILSGVDYSSDRTARVGNITNWTADISLYRNYHGASGESWAGGITLVGGRTNSYLPNHDGSFGQLQFGGGYIHPVKVISPQTEIRIEAYGQISTINTPDAKTLGLGSIDFLRGYETSTFVGTSGMHGTVEIAHSYFLFNDVIESITPFLFGDYGVVQNPNQKKNLTNRPKNDGLLSAGLGASVNLRNNLLLEGYVGAPLLADAGGNVPSPRAYMKMVWGW